MTPKREIITKKQKTAKGTSRRQLWFDENRFLGVLREARFRELASRKIWEERRFDIHLKGCFCDCVDIITDRSWEKLANPSTNMNFEIIKEFYFKALPLEGIEYSFTTLAWGKVIDFYRNSINEYLGRPLNLEEGETNAYSRRMQRGSWNIGRISQAILERGRIIVKNDVGVPTKIRKKTWPL